MATLFNLIFYLTNYIYLHFFIAVSKLISFLFKAYLWFNRLVQMATDLLSFLDFHIPSYFLRNHAPFYAPYHPTFYGYNYLMHRVCFVAQTRLFDIRYLLFRFFQMLIVYNFFHCRFVQLQLLIKIFFHLIIEYYKSLQTAARCL